MIEQALITYLSGALSGFSVFFGEIPPQSDDRPVSFPAIVFVREDRTRLRSTTGTRLQLNTFEFDCYHHSADLAATAGEQAANVLEGFVGQMGQYDITLCRVENEYDTQESASKSFARSFTLNINYRR